MPGYDGTGPRPGGRGGGGLGRRNRQGQGSCVNPGAESTSQGYVYEYTLEELEERKSALEKEIIWIEERMKEFKHDTSETD